MYEEILQQTDTYYTEKLQRFGASHWGVDWNSEASQRLRFAQLSRILSNHNGESFSLCDYGCGYGAYAQYLDEKEYPCAYTGMDISHAMVEAARRRCGADGRKQFLHGADIARSYDYIVSSGIFNVRQTVSREAWHAYLLDVLGAFDRHAVKGFAFNCLTKYSDADHMKDYLYYADPLELFDYCKRNFARNVALLHDYGLYEFTILVRKSL